jgi:hypothetical protein
MFALTIEGGLAKSGAPDVCKVPGPSGASTATPLINMFQLTAANPATACQKVFLGGTAACHLQTKFPISGGGESGAAGGVVSGRSIGPGWFSPVAGVRKVLLENRPAVDMGAQTLHNGDACFNTSGVCPLAAQAKVLVDP